MKSPILNEFGSPFDRPPMERIELASRPVRASYDAARTTDEFANYWAYADRFDADSAHSREVRQTLVSRSRLTLCNNGYADGIAQTYATDLIDCGPALHMMTGSTGFNQLIERVWGLWCKAVKLRSKLWCMAHAKYADGESLAVLRKNPRVRHEIPLDVVLVETEQCQTPYLPYGTENYIDGIKFDEFGNPIWYDILREHPGATNSLKFDLVPERVPADRVLHWFKLRRPGQHRGVPECASTLNVGAAAHRWREATLAAAETAADLNVMLTTQLTPDATTDPMAPFSSMPLQKRLMTAAPMGWDAHHFKSEHPNSSYESFHKSLVTEQARPKSMPFNKAACDSSNYNYASGRLDHQTYYAALDVEREDCNDRVLDPLFDNWMTWAIQKFKWLGGDPEAIGQGARAHTWDWPKHRVADVESEANANDTKLRGGQISMPKLKSEMGEDAEDEAALEAAYYGITVEELKQRQLDTIYPQAQKPSTKPPVAAHNRLPIHAN